MSSENIKSGLLKEHLEIKDYLRDIDAHSNKDDWTDLIGLCDNDDTGYSSPSTDILSAAIKRSGITKPKKTGKCVTKKFTKHASFSDSSRPDMSYKEMVAKILLKSEKGQLSLKEITEQVAKDYEYYAKSKSNWPSSIRHTLSVADCFVKAGRAKGGRGFMWKIAEPYIKFFKEGDFDMKNISLSILPLNTSTPKSELCNNSVSFGLNYSCNVLRFLFSRRLNGKRFNNYNHPASFKILLLHSLITSSPHQ